MEGASDFLNEHHGAEATKRREILVVDDEAHMANLTEDMLSVALPGFAVRKMLCPAEALIHLCGEGVDETALIVVDWRMHFIPGIDLAGMVRGKRVDGLDVANNMARLRSSSLFNMGGEGVHPVDSRRVRILTRTINQQVVFGLRLDSGVVERLRTVPTMLHTGSPEAFDEHHPDGSLVANSLRSGYLDHVVKKPCGVREFAAGIRKAALNATRSRRERAK